MNAHLTKTVEAVMEREASVAVQQTDFASATRIIWECDVCGTLMLDLHCKLRCTNCGFMRDCSDP